MGPIHYEPGGWVNTTVTCTNLATAPARIAFEVFDERDERAGSLAQAEVAAGASLASQPRPTSASRAPS